MAIFDRPAGQRQPVQIFLESNQSIVLTFDASVSEDHRGESEITDYPVEVGSDATDHVRARPVTFRLSGVITESPLIVDLVNNQPVNRTGQADGTRIGSAYAFLEQARTNAERVRVFTRLRTYSDMFIKSVRAPRNSRTGNAITFDIEFRQIRFGELEISRAPRPRRPARQPIQNLGAKSPDEAVRRSRFDSLVGFTADTQVNGIGAAWQRGVFSRGAGI